MWHLEEILGKKYTPAISRIFPNMDAGLTNALRDLVTVVSVPAATRQTSQKHETVYQNLVMEIARQAMLLF